MMLPLPIRPKPKNHYQDRPQLVQQCKAVHVGHKCSLPKGHHGRHWDFKAYRWPGDKQRNAPITKGSKQPSVNPCLPEDEQYTWDGKKPHQVVNPCPAEDGQFYCCETIGHPGPHYYQHHTSSGKLTYVWGKGMDRNTRYGR